MIYEYSINGLPLKTGDLICTKDGGGEILAGQFWRLIGKLIPGEVEHIVVYVGPEGNCVEAGGKLRVIEFEVRNYNWDTDLMYDQRGMIDTFYGVAYPLKGRDLPQDRENEIRKNIFSYCLQQAAARKPYNINFFNSETEEAFYCSQLAYKAYIREGINLNTNMGIPEIPGTQSIIFPQEIWSECEHKCA